MPDCLPYDWIGAPLRAAWPVIPTLPVPIAALVARIDGTPPHRTFAHDLIALMPRLRTHARSLTRDRDAAEDLVQETLLRAGKARDRFVAGTSLRAWTGTILRNIFLNQRERSRLDGDYDEAVAELRLARPETQSAVVELDDVRRAMETLAPDQREALRIVSVEGLSYEEGARRLGISVGSLKSRVSRGRRMLVSIIDGDGPRMPPRPAPRRGAPPSPAPARRPERPGASGRWSAARASGRPLWIG